MPRSDVLTGRFDARDRAHQRRRHDHRAPRGTDHGAVLRELLDRETEKLDSIEAAERYDLTAYLRRTGTIELPPAERLRQLAIALETRYYYDRRHWHVLERIYDAAVRLDPEDADVWCSRGISAANFVEVAQDRELDGQLARQGERALYRAMRLEPADAHPVWAMGYLVYAGDDAHATAAALRWFDRALELDPKHAAARLYRAHCLHDLKRWTEALAAYDAVPLAAFVGARAWMVDYVAEARAHCRLHAGDRDGALADFDALLRRYEREPRRAALAWAFYLQRAAEGELSRELGTRFAALAESLGFGDRRS